MFQIRLIQMLFDCSMTTVLRHQEKYFSSRSDTLGSQTSFTVIHTSSTLVSNALSSRSLESQDEPARTRPGPGPTSSRVLTEQKSTDSVGVTFRAGGGGESPETAEHQV